jgi:outer membrane protein TolC
LPANRKSLLRWRVEAADAGIAQAKANFYPDINISAFAGLSVRDWIIC